MNFITVQHPEYLQGRMFLLKISIQGKSIQKTILRN
jgi:hypothetical protein